MPTTMRSRAAARGAGGPVATGFQPHVVAHTDRDSDRDLDLVATSHDDDGTCRGVTCEARSNSARARMVILAHSLAGPERSSPEPSGDWVGWGCDPSVGPLFRPSRAARVTKRQLTENLPETGCVHQR